MCFMKVVCLRCFVFIKVVYIGRCLMVIVEMVYVAGCVNGYDGGLYNKAIVSLHIPYYM